jgi:hypothetical protein
MENWKDEEETRAEKMDGWIIWNARESRINLSFLLFYNFFC